MKYIFWCFAVVGLFIVTSCSDETEVGAGLLGSEDLEVIYDDDFALSAKTIVPESILSYFISTTSVYPVVRQALGTQNDPEFGRTSSSLLLVPSTARIPAVLDTIRFIDSMVMTLSLDTALYFGDSTQPINIEVFEILEKVEGDSIFSNATYAVSSEPIGVRNQVIISEIDTVNVPVSNTSNFDSTQQVTNILRIPLSDEYGSKALNVLRNAEAPADFEEGIYGYQVRVTSGEGLFFINLPFSETGGQRNSVSMYYRDTDNLRQEFVIPFGRRRKPVVKQIQHDFSGSTLEELIDVPVSEDDLLYVKSLGTAYVELDLSDVQRLQDVLVNHASLEFFVSTEVNRDTTEFPLAQRFGLLTKETGGFSAIQDLILENRFFVEGIFDGNREVDATSGLIRYEMNITTYLKELLKGQEDGTVFITIFDEIQTASSAILYGPNHPDYPIKLKVTYTKS